MGSIRDAGRAAFRDFVVEGVPASGENEPEKQEIRQTWDVVDAAVEDLKVRISEAGTRIIVNTCLLYTSDAADE